MKKLNQRLLYLAKKIQLLVLDVDGVMTDGKIYYGNQEGTLDGQCIEMMAFNIKDGKGITQLIQEGIEVAIITGRQSEMVARRAKNLGIKRVIQNRTDKGQALQELLAEINVNTDGNEIKTEHVAYMGDDTPDIPAMELCALSFAPADAYEKVLSIVDYCTQCSGGYGAVREVADILLLARK